MGKSNKMKRRNTQYSDLTNFYRKWPWRITNEPIGVLFKREKSSKCHFKLFDKGYNVVSDCKITLTDQIDSTENLRRRESFEQNELDTFESNGLNEGVMWPFFVGLFYFLIFDII